MQNTIYINNQERGGTSLLSVKYYHSSIYGTMRYYFNYKGNGNITVSVGGVTQTFGVNSSTYLTRDKDIDISSLSDGYIDIEITADADVDIKNIIFTEVE